MSRGRDSGIRIHGRLAGGREEQNTRGILSKTQEQLMRLISIVDLRTKSEEEWRRLEEDVVVTSGGDPIAILTPVTEGRLEESLVAIQRARAVAAVREMQRRSAEQGLDALTDRDIEAEIAAVRRSRKTRLNEPG
jgi:antitoxin (DNA-binding transcriptional repressor) of toxin-antitoxin stability system